MAKTLSGGAAISVERVTTAWAGRRKEPPTMMMAMAAIR